jgi:glycosyltransferase involved in cell wall biosynthesis
LERTLRSIDYSDDIEVVISEDCSPRRMEIKEMVEKVDAELNLNILLNLNENNLGYDNNLGKLKEIASGKYILYMSDDDAFVPGALEELCGYLKYHDIACGYTPFFVKGNLYRKYREGFSVASGKEGKEKNIFDAILFSGLIFKRELVGGIDSGRFVNCNYFQVYLLLAVLTQYGGDYIDIPLVECISDGENAFGNVPSSSASDNEMRDRKSIFAALALQKGLIKAIKMYDEDYNNHILDLYAKDYSKTSFSHMCKAKKEGRLDEYYIKMHEIGIKIGCEAAIYYYMIKFLGAELSSGIMQLPRKIYQRKRMNSI